MQKCPWDLTDITDFMTCTEACVRHMEYQDLMNELRFIGYLGALLVGEEGNWKGEWDGRHIRPVMSASFMRHT